MEAIEVDEGPCVIIAKPAVERVGKAIKVALVLHKVAISAYPCGDIGIRPVNEWPEASFIFFKSFKKQNIFSPGQHILSKKFFCSFPDITDGIFRCQI